MTTLSKQLESQIPAISNDWYQLIASAIPTPHEPGEVRQQIRALTERFINLVYGTGNSAEEAEAFGSTLADSNFIQPETFGPSQELLAKRLLHHTSNKRAERLAAILGCMSTGYFRRSRNLILKKQEEGREAHMTAHADGLEQLVAERTRELSALYDVTAVATEFLDGQTILDKTLDRALSALTRRTGTIQLLDENSQSLKLAAYAGVSRETAIQLNSTASEMGLIDRVFENRRQMVAADEEGDLARFIESGYPTKYGAIVCTPMRNQGRIVGILNVFDSAKTQFSVEELALVASIADHMGVAIESARLRDKATQIAIVEEQKRLARELHDSVTQALYSLTLFTEAALENGRAGNLVLVHDQLEELSATSQQALKEMRLLLYELRASKPERDGLIDALRHRLDSVELRSGMTIRLQAEAIENIAPFMERELYLIAVGALNNIIRHAQATVVDVSIIQTEASLLMEIADNGKGFDLGAVNQRGGMGLDIMRERAENIEAQLEIETSPGTGTRVRVLANLRSGDDLP